MHKPKVSILCPSFNHEQYVHSFLNSALSQTENDFELIIVDDCSSDHNLEEIYKVHDHRVTIVEHQYNKGINAALNTAFEASQGEYIAFIASDDLLEPTYIENVTKCFELHPHVDIFYTSLLPVDDENNVVEAQKERFVRKQRSRYALLKDMFYKGNQLLSPGMAMRRNVFESLYPLDLSLVQYQDYKMHINILLEFNPFFSTECCVRYRVPSKRRGISKDSLTTKIREDFETSKLLDSYLAIKDVWVLEKIFGDAVSSIGRAAPETIPYFLARLALQSDSTVRRRWGYQVLMRCIQDQSAFDALHAHYGFDFKNFISSIEMEKKKGDIVNLKKYKKKINKYKKLFFFSSFLTLILMIILMLVLCQQQATFLL